MKYKRYIAILRFLHFLIVLYLITGIVYIYYSAINQQTNGLVVLFIISLVIEGILVYANRGNCPLAFIQRRYGDNTPFFDLILPHHLAKHAVKFFALISIIGIAFFIIRVYY